MRTRNITTCWRILNPPIPLYEKSERLQICSSKITCMRVEVGFSAWMVVSCVFLLMILWFL